MKITKKDFAEEFGVEVENLPKIVTDIIDGGDFDIEFAKGLEKEKEILYALKKLAEDTQVVATPERKFVWNNGWNENREEFKRARSEKELFRALIPKYYHPGNSFRWKQEFVRGKNPFVEYEIFDVIRTYILATYAPPYETVYEFGCGTGHNLVRLVQMFPRKFVTGLDFVPSAIELLKDINRKFGYNIHGKLFDMIHPDYNFHLQRNSCVFTFYSIEQLNKNTKSIVDYLLAEKPSLCVHCEPVLESYDDDVLIDWIAKQFHLKRGYELGLLKNIQNLEESGKAVIKKIKRIRFGSLTHEPCTLIVWQPL